MKKKQFTFLIASILLISACTENTSSTVISSESSLISSTTSSITGSITSTSSSTSKASSSSSSNEDNGESIGKTITVSTTKVWDGETTQSEGSFTYRYYPKTRTMVSVFDSYYSTESYTETTKYDEENRVLLNQSENEGGLIFKYDYTYSGDNPNYDTKTYYTNNGVTTKEIITYDSSYQKLTTIQGKVKDNQEITPSYSNEYTYDSYGNILSNDYISYNSKGEKAYEYIYKYEYVYDEIGRWTDQKVYKLNEDETWILTDEYVKEYDEKGREILSERYGAPFLSYAISTDLVVYEANIYQEDGSYQSLYYEEGCDWIAYYKYDYGTDGQLLEKDYFSGYTQTESFLDHFSLDPYQKDIYSYDQGKLVKKEVFKQSNSTKDPTQYYLSKTTKIEYDASQRPISIENYSNSSLNYSYQVEYDDKGRCVKQVYQDSTTTKTYTATFTEDYNESLDFSEEFLDLKVSLWD